MGIGLAAIILVGISAGFPNPGNYTQINFAAGPTGAAPVGQKILILGNKTSSGSATADTVVYGPDTSTPAQTESDVITLTGPGSQVHRAWKRSNKVNKTTPIYFCCVAESAGAQATGVVLVGGTTATSAGNIRFFYGDEFVDTPVNTNDTTSSIATNIATNINNNVNWAITAAAVSGQITVTAKNHGPEGNLIKIGVVLGPGFEPGGVTVTDYGVLWSTAIVTATGSFIAPATPNGYYYKVTTGGTGGGSPPSFGTTIGVTTTDNTATYTCWGTLSTSAQVAQLGGGATADNVTNALATIQAQGYYDIIVCDSDATNIGRVVTQVNSQANPTTGILQRVFAGSIDTLANATTAATGINAPRCELQWGASTDITPLELAANAAGIYSLFEQSGNTGYRVVGRLNFSLFPTGNPQFNDQASWFLTPSRNGPSAGPSTVQITSALTNGLTPYAITNAGTLQLVKRVTTRSLNGSTSDYRIRDAHKVAVMDATATLMSTTLQQQFGAKDILDVPPANQAPAAGQPPNVFATNVQIIGNALKDIVDKVGLAGLLQNTDVTNANAIIQRETSPKTRVSASFDLQTADILDQICLVANQVG